VAFDATLGKTLVYDINGGGGVEAIDANTGRMVWSSTVPYGKVAPDQGQEDVSTMAIDGNTLYFGTTAALIAMNATTGATDCTFAMPIESPATQPGIIDSSPVVGNFDPSGPIVFFGDKGQSEAYNGGHEWAITGVGNTAGGCHQVWAFNGWQNEIPPRKLVGSWSPPALVQSASGTWLLVLGSSDPDDAVYALNASTGAVVWRFQTPPDGPDHDVGTGATISPPGADGSPDGVVYLDGKDTIEFALDLSTGSPIWSFDMGKDTGTSVDAVSGGALVGNTLYVPYYHWVYAFDATTGAVLWRTDVGSGTFYSSSSISMPGPGKPGDPVLILGSQSGTVYALDATDGHVLASVSLGSAVYSSAAFLGPKSFEADAAGKVVALSVAAPTAKMRLQVRSITGDYP
jgi:outer membrane protein assembly factor BamB